MAANQKKKKRRLKRSVRTTLYLVVLCAFSLVLYNTLFIKAFTPTAADANPIADASVSNTDSKDSDSSQNSKTADGTDQDKDDSSTDADDTSYTTYPDTGETVATVLLDAGHGGFDSGNVAPDGTLEKDINLEVTQMIAKKLEELNPQIKVLTIRDDDNVDWGTTDVEDLNYRTAQQDATGADYFISIHCNSFDDPSVKGFMYFINDDDSVMAGMTEEMTKNLTDVGWSEYFGTQLSSTSPLQVVTMSNIHSVLIEMGYMSNPDDLAQFENKEDLQKAADAIAAAISDYIMAHPDDNDYVSVQEKNSAAYQAQQNTDSADTSQ